MQESKFLISGQHVRPHDGSTVGHSGLHWQTSCGCCSTLQRTFLDFVISKVEIDETEVEVVRLQSLI